MEFKRIESRANPSVKFVCELHEPKGRRQNEKFCFEGVHLLEEYIRSGNVPEMLFVREDVVGAYSALIAPFEDKVITVTPSVYEKMSLEKAPQGILTVSSFLPNVKFVKELPKEASESGSCMIVDLQDTGNVGTIVRTSASLGAGVILAGNCADIYSPKTVRATMGALFNTDIYVCEDVLRAVASLQKAGVRVIASALTDDSVFLGEFDTDITDCFVVGNEGKGLPENVIKSCDMTVKIKMSGRTESLNAASAASIMLWELKRGRL